MIAIHGHLTRRWEIYPIQAQFAVVCEYILVALARASMVAESLTGDLR